MKHSIDSSYLAHSPSGKQWMRIGVKQHHGCVIPLFSIRSKNSLGIGEYLDLLPLIDWFHEIGFSILQLLPLNDTGRNPSPYTTLTAFALNPIHLSLWKLPLLDEFPDLKKGLNLLPKFSSSQFVEYTSVREIKELFLSDYYQKVGQILLKSDDYQQFSHSSPWLLPYAVFKTLKIQFDWKSWEEWPLKFQFPTPALIEEISNQYREEVEKYSLIQFLCYSQMKQVRNYSDSKGIFLMGDIPILTDRDSADVWLHRNLFHLDMSAGAPPDQFSDEGQNWGFPLYNWDEIAKGHYQWWNDRLKYADHFYHMYRIDHIVGLFRIWAIPRGEKTKSGSFIPNNPDVWIDHGQKILMEFLKASSMLPIGEDLGVIPPEVRNCLEALGICGMKVIRWERDWNHTRKFTTYENYTCASLTTLSTHDSQPLGLWWELKPDEAGEFCHFKGWTYQPKLSHDYLREILWDSHHTPSLLHINLIQEYLHLVPCLSWPSYEHDIINHPGTISDRNWCYRIKPSIEELTTNPTLMHLIREIII